MTTNICKKSNQKFTLPLLLVLTLGGLLVNGSTATPLAQLIVPAEWKAWRVAGNWQWTGDWVGGAGTGTWQYAEVGDASWKDYRVDLSLRLDTATTRLAPKWEGGFACFRNNQNIAGYEAGLAVRKTGDEMYRVMFSLPFQEVMLWSSRGGFLQVAPLKVETGKVYQVTALARGPHIEVTVDQRTVIDYRERHGVLTTGGVALGLHGGTGAFSKVTVSSMPAFSGQVPPHVADLRFRDWKGTRWAWDGNEPIFLVHNNCIGYQLKLVPGWRAQMDSWWHWLNYGNEAFYQDKLTDFKVLEEGKQLRFLVVGTDNKEKTWLTGRCEVKVTYDPARNAYVHDMASDLIIPDGHSLKMGHPVEFTDPVLYGHVGSASPHDTWETPHPWSVYKHVSGKLYKLPHNHAGWYPGFNDPPYQQAKGGRLDPQGGFWALVGDPVANPVLSVQGSSVPGSEFRTDLCGWAFDVHMQWFPVKQGGIISAGVYTVKWRLTSVDGKQGGDWLKEAEFCAPGDLNKTLLLYTAGIGEPEKFNTVVKWASPFYMYPWGDGSLQDTTVGHGDKTSLRLVGLRSAGSVVGTSVFNDPVLENTDYEVSAWVKMKDVQGNGPGLVFGRKSYFPGITGTHGWQKIGFVCRPDGPLYMPGFMVLNSGSGTVWFDDFMIRPLKAGEKPAAPIAAEPKPIAPAAAGEKILAWDGGSYVNDEARTLLDRAGHGGHGRMEGTTVAVVDDDSHRVLEINGDQGYVTTDQAYSFPPPQSLTVWIKPGKLTNDWNMIATGGPWNRAWSLFLYKQTPYIIDFRAAGWRFTEGVVPQDKWSHLAVVDDGKTCTIYFNGKSVKTDKSAGANWTPEAPGPLVLGTMLYYGKPIHSFCGRIGAVTLWNKALTAEEVKAEFNKGLR